MSGEQPSGDRDDLDFEIPTPMPSHEGSSIVSAAAGALGIAGIFTLAGSALFGFTGGAGGLIAIVGVFGLVQLAVAFMVYRRVTAARSIGLAVAVVGFAFGLYRFVGGSGNAAIDLIAYGFVVWALATSGGAFRRG